MLVFGEDANDGHTLKELLAAAAPGAPAAAFRRKPLILIRGESAARDKKNAAEVAAVVRSDQQDYDVRCVIAHRDCDAVEPAHRALAAAIELHLTQAGAPSPIAATPAWETETWLFLWPAAVGAVCAAWAGRLDVYKGRDLGRMRNAKEELKSALRPGPERSGREYRESDGPTIARKVRELDLIDTRAARSASFDRFLHEVRRVFPTPPQP